MASVAEVASRDETSLLRNWREVLLTGGLRPGKRVDPVSRWLILTRASVLPMTLTSGLIGGLLAAGHPQASWLFFSVSLVGLLVAHACNNLMNDYFDFTSGVDTSVSPRALYAPHPVLAGWVSEGGLLRAILLLNGVGAVILAVLFTVRGWPVVALAAAGLFVSVFYVAPPLRLKHRGLGEPGVFVVWGPLMIGGTYYVTTGELPAWVWVASIPYAILVTTVLIGKHVDKLEHDSQRGVRTLPVVLGERNTLLLNQGLMVSFYLVVAGLVVSGTLGVGALLVFASVPLCLRMLKLYSEPRPKEPPPGYRIWPLWYVASAFVLTRRAGMLFVAGLLLDRLLPFG
ncbi:MAG: prenyltransferase [Candidatus Binatia bacterium]